MLVKTQNFLQPSANTVVFFLCPYATPVRKIQWSVKSLMRAGYSVIAYEYPRIIFRSGDPAKLFQTVEETRMHITQTIKELQGRGYKEFGFFGSSLGAFIAYNCLGSVPELAWGIMNTGGNITEAVWSFQAERSAFKAKGYTKDTLAKAWQPLQYPELGDLTNKNYILITSKGDKTVSYPGALECFGMIEAAGPEVQVIVHRKLSHRATVVRNLLRIRKLVKTARAKSGAAR